MAVNPVESDERIAGLDAVRGVALAGILWANVRQMFMPWDVANLPLPLGAGENLAWFDWAVFHAFIDLKFLTLFSLLFGIGFALQARRLAADEAGFGAVYARRLVILGFLGIAHALFLYPAEVLMPYAVAGALLLATRGWSAATLLRVGVALLAAAALWSWQLHALAGDPAEGYRLARAQLDALEGADPSSWPKEAQVRRLGGFAERIALHSSQYAEILFYFVILMLWRTLGLFMIGASIVRGGWLARADWPRVACVGLGVGLPLTILATALQIATLRGASASQLPVLLHELAALALAAGLFGAVLVLHRRER